MTYKCRVVSQQFRANQWPDFAIDNMTYSPRLALTEANALLVLCDPTEELLDFKGPKLWFTIEPSWHHHFHSHRVGRRLVCSLRSDERAWFAHPLASHRVPHPTFRRELTRPRAAFSKNAAAACVTNFGGRAWFLKRHFLLRNRMILSPLVELFGEPQAWSNFRNFPKLWQCGPPENFQGRSSPGRDDKDEEHIRFLSTYKVAVCLENCVGRHYFTEKFVNAVRAGCIPVYHAHPSVVEQFLRGAKWVDPAAFGFSPRRTIAFALAQDQTQYRRVNDLWLESGTLMDTDDQKVVPRLHQILRRKLPMNLR
jgi:hypothetical protein